MDFSWNNMCRACMNEEGSMYSLYSKDKTQEINVIYSEMIMNFTSIQVGREDALPQQICQYCLKQLIQAYTFKQTIERSDATLREITKNPTSEIEFIKEEFIKEEYMDDVDPDPEPPGVEGNSCLEQLDESDFKLTAEYLDDDYQIKEEEVEDDSLSPISEFIPSIEQLKEVILKPKINHHKANKQTATTHPVRKQYVCPLCSKRFVKFETFRKHKKIHTLLKCELCDKEFRSTHGLRYHMKVHSGVKNYACTFDNCEKKFRLKQALDKHLSIHNNEKNHLCPICGKTYAQYDALHYHIRNHTGERPYLCVHCGKTFKQSCHLKNHMWNHTGIKPYKCKSCGKCYTTGHQLKKHLRKYCNNPSTNNQNIGGDIIHIRIVEEQTV